MVSVFLAAAIFAAGAWTVQSWRQAIPVAGVPAADTIQTALRQGKPAITGAPARCLAVFSARFTASAAPKFIQRQRRLTATTTIFLGGEAQGMAAHVSAPPLTAAEAASVFSARLFAFINRRVKSRDVAEDLLQQVLLRVTRHEEKLAVVDDPQAWLFAVTRSVIADHYRRSSQPHPDIFDWMEYDEPAATALLTDCIGSLLNQLPAPYKEALTRVDLGGETRASDLFYALLVFRR